MARHWCFSNAWYGWHGRNGLLNRASCKSTMSCFSVNFFIVLLAMVLCFPCTGLLSIEFTRNKIDQCPHKSDKKYYNREIGESLAQFALRWGIQMVTVFCQKVVMKQGWRKFLTNLIGAFLMIWCCVNWN